MSGIPMLRVQCWPCKGTGQFRPEDPDLPCPTCHGRGIIRMFPTPIEAEIAKRKAIDEACDYAGL